MKIFAPIIPGTLHGDDYGMTGPSTVVAVPACNEEARIGTCLAALAMQRDAAGAPLPGDTFEVVVLANNCSDGTAAAASSMAGRLPYRLQVAERTLPPERAHAGWARKLAMDLAADALERRRGAGGFILTSDADSRASPTWVAATLAAFAAGADGVAGYVDADADEFVALGPAFGSRGRAEDRYLRAIAEIHALCDPRAHDPWPNHRVASGASLAVSLSAYRRIGGLPPHPLGEDAALVGALEGAGLRVRHALDVLVTTSCRFDGRAPGGAADTMRARHAAPEAVCDADLEPASRVLRRAAWEGRLRRIHAGGRLDARLDWWAGRLGLSRDAARALSRAGRDEGFARMWASIRAASPRLGPRRPLRPSELPRETRRAARIIALLRSDRVRPPRSEHPADRPARGYAAEPATA